MKSPLSMCGIQQPWKSNTRVCMYMDGAVECFLSIGDLIMRHDI